MPEVTLKLKRASVRLVTQHEYFATALLRFPLVRDASCETAWTDGTQIGYNPEFIRTCTLDEVVGVLAHEVLHILLLHPWRRGDRDPRNWNVATDQTINHHVLAAGLVLPAGCIPPVPDRNAEALYGLLPAPSGGGNQPRPKPGAGGGKPQQPQPGADPGRSGEVRDTPTRSPAAREAQQQAVRQLASQAANVARRAGTLNAGLAQAIGDALAPQVPWLELLNRFVDQHARNDYSWSRPNRRYLSSGFILPSLYSEQYGEVVVACDMSGSVNQHARTLVCSELLGVLEAYASKGQAVELTVAWFDTKVYEQQVTDAAELKPQGGGGTRFASVMEWLVARHELPRALVMVTDGHCNNFGADPGVPVLWVLTAENRRFQPPFGELCCVLNH